MTRNHANTHRALTLLEVILVVGVLAAIAWMIVPTFVREIEREKLPGSVRQLRSLLTLVRANAAFDGKRYRIRFPMEDEEDALGGYRQPIVEREDDPLWEPEIFNEMTAPWAVGETFFGQVWCIEVRLGRPNIETLRELEDRGDIEDLMEDTFKDFDPLRPPLHVEPDGTTDWVTFVITDAPRDTGVDELLELMDLEECSAIELIVDGNTGLAWMQRPFYEEEVDLFEERGWPVVLRQDFLDKRVLTEEDVLELRDVPMDRSDE